jgi:hypothetical protein
MHALWRLLLRIVFWSFERGTWPYDLAVALIVVFVLFSPRSWFNDRPLTEAAPAVTSAQPPAVELRSANPADGSEIYRVDARLVTVPGGSADVQLESQLYEAVRQSSKGLGRNGGFEIVRIAPVAGRNGEVVYYDVCIRR